MKDLPIGMKAFLDADRVKYNNYIEELKQNEYMG